MQSDHLHTAFTETRQLIERAQHIPRLTGSDNAALRDCWTGLARIEVDDALSDLRHAPYWYEAMRTDQISTAYTALLPIVAAVGAILRPHSVQRLTAAERTEDQVRAWFVVAASNDLAQRIEKLRENDESDRTFQRISREAIENGTADPWKNWLTPTPWPSHRCRMAADREGDVGPRGWSLNSVPAQGRNATVPAHNNRRHHD